MASPPGLIVAAPASGSGKTVLTLGLLRALRDRGVAVASFKIGPDYIDPGFHAAASGRPCFNLDSWAMRPALLAETLRRAAEGAELVIGEGVMGLFDGAGGGRGSTADLAAWARLPLLLVVDARGQGASAAATVLGFAGFRDEIALAGVIFNRVASEAHRRALEDGLERLAGRVPLLGCIPGDARLAVPHRHLGLVQASETRGLEDVLGHAGAIVAANVDLARLKSLARPPAVTATEAAPDAAPLGQRIALARDPAFSFVYRHVLDGWRRAGAEVVPFSPLADQPPDAAADAVFLPGGYPELHAGRLGSNRRFLEGLRAAARRGARVYGECGGYMVLGETLTDAEGKAHPMAGLLPLATSFAERRLHLGYRTATLVADGPLGPAGASFRGHEFHYATVIREETGAPLFRAADSRGKDLGPAGSRRGTVMGSFVHLIDRA